MSSYGSRRHNMLSFGSIIRNLLIMGTGSVALIGCLTLFGTWRSGTRFFQNLANAFTLAQPEPQVDVRSVVVQQVRSLSELTTAVFAMEAVVPTSRDRTLGGYTIGRTTLLYIAYGEVRAGVDLSELGADDVQVSGETVRLRLPPPRILDSKIDVTRSSVYDYDRGFLGLGPDAAPELQSLAQQTTLQRIVETACDQGLLLDANERADVVVSQLLSSAGYKEFLVETQPPASDACVAAPASTALTPSISAPPPAPAP